MQLVFKLWILLAGANLVYCNPPKGKFVVMNEEKTFFEAWRGCQYYGLRLASIRTKEDNEILRNLLQKPEHSSSTFWLGGTDMGMEGRWIWITNNAPLIIFSNWSSDNPDNSNNQDCMVVGSEVSDPTLWDDVQCAQKHKYICER